MLVWEREGAAACDAAAAAGGRSGATTAWHASLHRCRWVGGVGGAALSPAARPEGEARKQDRNKAGVLRSHARQQHLAGLLLLLLLCARCTRRSRRSCLPPRMSLNRWHCAAELARPLAGANAEAQAGAGARMVAIVWVSLAGASGPTAM